VPNVATWKEQGVDFVFPHWRGVMAAPDLSPAQQKFWADTIDKMVKSKTWKKSLETLGWDDFYTPHKDYVEFLDKQDALMRESLSDVGLIK
jgi:tripartite-type tricarboxylate transporter receptor subunit TctC